MVRINQEALVASNRISDETWLNNRGLLSYIKRSLEVPEDIMMLELLVS